MLAVSRIRVLSLDLDFLDVLWEIEDTSEDVQDYQFEVLRSEGPAGPWEALTPKFQDAYVYRDATAPQLSKHRRLFYKIRVTHVPSGAIADWPRTAEGVSQVAELDLEGAEIAQHMKLLLAEYIGRKVWVFPVRTFGQRCAACFDTATGRRSRSQCPTCLDTGYAGGYHSPIETSMQIDPHSNDRTRAPMADGEVVNTAARLSNWPPLKPRDVIVEAENRRWRVLSVRQTERLRSPVHQEVYLHMIPRTDIEHRLPVGVTLSTHQPSPERQFTNPQGA